MRVQYKTVIVLLFLTSIINISKLKTQQLALPYSIIAKVGAQEIKFKEFKDRYTDYLFSSGVKDNIVVRRAVLNNMINEMLLLKYDDNERIFGNPEFQREINWLEKQSILAYLKDKEIYAKITADESELREAFYKSNVKLSARHLYAETEEEADALYQLLQTGSSFFELATQVFTDSILANNGGYLGYFSWGDMDPNFEDAAYSLHVGEVSKPVQTRSGFSIIKVEDRIPNPIMTEDEFIRKKSHLERIIRIRKKRDAELDFLKNLFDNRIYKLNQNVIADLYDEIINSNKIITESIHQTTGSVICAEYGNKLYTKADLANKIEQIPFYHKSKITSVDALATIVKGLVIQDLLYSLAVDNDYQNNTEVKTTIEKYNIITFLKYKREEISRSAAIQDEIIYQYYLDNLHLFTGATMINVQEIIVKSEKLADSLHTLIINGSDFGTIAKTHSLRRWSAENNGVIGLDDINKFGLLKDRFNILKINEVIGPIKIDNYFGIFKLIERVEGKPIKYGLVKNEAERFLKKERSKEIMNNYLDNLKKNVNVLLNDSLLANMIVN
jgi:parvulin-like peptidyl-prolyl isomerase